jgi:hypothetical protein
MANALARDGVPSPFDEIARAAAEAFGLVSRAARCLGGAGELTPAAVGEFAAALREAIGRLRSRAGELEALAGGLKPGERDAVQRYAGALRELIGKLEGAAAELPQGS